MWRRSACLQEKPDAYDMSLHGRLAVEKEMTACEQGKEKERGKRMKNNAMEWKLYTPVEARTKDSILLLWDKVNKGSEKLNYDIYVDDVLFSTVSVTDETITGLAPDTEYLVQIKVWYEGNEYATKKVPVKTKKAGKQYNILDFGAVSGKGHVNTEAIQRAIDTCEKDGIVYVPPGVFYTGALFLHSHMTLELAEGAKLTGTGKVEDFSPFYYSYEGRWEKCYASLLNVRTLPQYQSEHTPQYDFAVYEDISVIGKGVIDGNGEALFQEELKEQGKISRGRTICIRNTTGLYFYGITVKNSPAWCLHPIYCKNMTINQIKLYNKFDEEGKPYSHFNGDGIDPDSCQDVYICHSYIQSQDDSIALKSGREPLGQRLSIPTKNVRITNCELSYGFGIVAGSEMSGSVMHVLIQDICMDETYSAVSLKTRRGRGGKISDIVYENLVLKIEKAFYPDDKWFRGAICIDQFYGDEMPDFDTGYEQGDGTSSIEDVKIENVTIDMTKRYGIYMCGLPENHIRNIVLKNISIRGGEGCFMKNVD